MEKVGLKHRPTFLENYISPASEAGFLKVLYPDKPNYPRQKIPAHGKRAGSI